MSPLALALVLAAAVAHASWNLLLKRVGGGLPLVWLLGALSAAIYAPLALALVVVQRPPLGGMALLSVLGSALLHVAYFALLQRGYRVGDLSLVYPLARGTGPLLSTLAAIALFGERPSALALAGVALIVSSVVALTLGSRGLRGIGNGGAVGYGVLCGTAIAAYTLWDKRAVAVLLVPPLLLEWGSNLGRAALLTPVARRRWREVRHHWRVDRREVLAVALLSPIAYILVLTALVFTPVSYVAPAREVSILIGAALGSRLLAEGDARRRLVAAGAMVLGIAALALG